jgi:excisionase family DNA binding protein
MITVTQAAQILGITGRRVRALIKSGKLGARRIGSVWVLDRKEVEDRKKAI